MGNHVTITKLLTVADLRKGRRQGRERREGKEGEEERVGNKERQEEVEVEEKGKETKEEEETTMNHSKEDEELTTTHLQLMCVAVVHVSHTHCHETGLLQQQNTLAM